MTTKFKAINRISIRGENDTEKILLQNFHNLIVGGKEVTVTVEDNDLIVSCVSKEETE